MAIFKGAGVAIITPMKTNLEVDYDAFAAIIEDQIAGGTDAIVVCGTTGEASTLSHEEHINVIKYCVEKVAGRIPVIAGTGSNSTDTAIFLSREAQKVGVDGLLLVTPYYNKATQKGLFEHFRLIANSVNVPILLYNIPGRTGVTLAPETIVKLCTEVENIVGVKEASGNFSAIAKLMSLANGKVDLYSGNDDQIVPLLSLGGKGVISVLSNVAPRQAHEICQNYFDGNVEESCRMQLEAIELINALFCEVNPIPVKKAMNLLGKCTDGIRRPLTVMEDSNVERLRDAMTKYGILSSGNDSESRINERLQKEMNESRIR
ncbi:MAG: 4-hydroxy-tetrahydrodipicolinate synthase [Lachnospiraceae bacterium]|nr:4-hydroxy-tetrahydrodipicolinate synthase [Lachnospiraceae bacterium]